MMEIDEFISRISFRLAEVERRIDTMIQRGPITEVDVSDPQAPRVRMALGQQEDGSDFLSPKVPQAQVAGALKIHSPASPGQTGVLISPGGDPRQGFVLPLGFSSDNPSPSTVASDHVITLGDAKIEFRGSEIVVTIPKVKLVCGGSTFELTASGLHLVTGGVTSDWTDGGHSQTGGSITHDGHAIDKTHEHTNSTPGPSLTGPPA